MITDSYCRDKREETRKLGNPFDKFYLLQDKLMTVPSDAASGTAGNWLFKNKEHGKTSAAASLVYLYLRDRLTSCVHILEVEIVTEPRCFPC